MKNELDIGDFLELSGQLPVIDVRSPGEFEKGHIPGAHNIPLFTNEERALVGTLYKQKGRDAAVLAGLDIVGPKMSAIVKRSRELAVNNEVLVHCWRGGMRSGSVCWLLNTAGIRARTLRKGYKAYRNFVLQCFQRPLSLLILGGETGSGKTEILHHIRSKGEQVIDLEAIACHKGSSFGAIGQDAQPTPEQFENRLAAAWSRLDVSKRVWVEDESKHIGRVYLPDALWEQMKVAPIVRVAVPRSERIKRLVKEYGSAAIKELEAAILRIEKRLGNQAMKESLEALQQNDLARVADLTLYYYDKAYNHNHVKREFRDVHFLEVEGDDPERTAVRAIAFANTQLTKEKA
jgi:tRNA 2-selenouridine synthase